MSGHLHKLQSTLHEMFKHDADIQNECEISVQYIWKRALEQLIVKVDSDELVFIQKDLECMEEVFWNRLHAVYYQNVSRGCRIGYAICLHLKAMVFLQLFEKNGNVDCLRAAIKSLDKIIIMVDCPILRSDIHQLVLDVQSKILSIEDPILITTVQEESIPENQETVEVNYQVERVSATRLTREEFRRRVDTNKPFLITDGPISDWPAIKKWANINSLMETMGPDRLVPVEIGSKYTENGWTQKLLTVRQFFSRYTGNSQADDNIVYLAQHDIFHQMPHLLEYIKLPEYLEGEMKSKTVINGWIGPAGTVSPLHTDPHDNLFAQVVGSKYIRLYSPAETDRLYPFENDHLMSNTSQVDIGSVDFEKFPLFPQAEYLDVIVGAGDLLFIPVGWWHYVKSLSPSVSVSFWFDIDL